MPDRRRLRISALSNDRAARHCPVKLELVCRNTSTATTTTAALSSNHTQAWADVALRKRESRPSAAAGAAHAHPIGAIDWTGGTLPVSPSRRRRRGLSRISFARAAPVTRVFSIIFPHFVGPRELVKRGHRCPEAAPSGISELFRQLSDGRPPLRRRRRAGSS